MEYQPEIDPSFIDKDRLDPRIASVLSQKQDGLWYLGNISLLSRVGISFCGSRKASDKGSKPARQCAEEAVKLGVGTISGNASGVDLNVHGSTLENGGWSIFVLAEGIQNFRVKKTYSEVWDWERCLVVSQYKPEDRWQVWRAMERNNLIIALGIAMIVIEAGETGGTREAARQTMKSGKPLFAVIYQDSVAGNQAILNDGASLLGISKSNGRPNIAKVISSVEAISTTSLEQQQSLPL